MTRKRSAHDHVEPTDPRSIRCPTCNAFVGAECSTSPVPTIDVDLWVGGRVVTMTFHAARVRKVNYGDAP